MKVQESFTCLKSMQAGISGIFSSLSARKKNVDRKALVLQYNAWDKCAEALIRKVNELAS
jgi:hypothetical protein